MLSIVLPAATAAARRICSACVEAQRRQRLLEMRHLKGKSNGGDGQKTSLSLGKPKQGTRQLEAVSSSSLPRRMLIFYLFFARAAAD